MEMALLITAMGSTCNILELKEVRRPRLQLFHGMLI
jgi:hypothetical protein